MKNIKNLWMFFALFILLSSCNENQGKMPKEEEVVTFEAPEQIISLEEADSLFVNYQNRRIPTIVKTEAQFQEDGKPFVPTQFISFDIDVLKDYIGYVEQEAKKGGTKADSIRIYLGNYGTRSKKYERKNTLFLLPTAEVNGEYGGIFIDSDGNAKLVRQWFNESQNTGQGNNQKSEASILPMISSAPSLQGGTSLALNFGGSGPPPKTDF